jgi:hypothetical protein
MELILTLTIIILSLGVGIGGTYLLLRPHIQATVELDSKTAQQNEEIKSEKIKLLAESSSLENINLTLFK